MNFIKHNDFLFQLFFAHLHKIFYFFWNKLTTLQLFSLFFNTLAVNLCPSLLVLLWASKILGKWNCVWDTNRWNFANNRAENCATLALAGFRFIQILSIHDLVDVCVAFRVFNCAGLLMRFWLIWNDRNFRSCQKVIFPDFGINFVLLSLWKF